MAGGATGQCGDQVSLARHFRCHVGGGGGGPLPLQSFDVFLNALSGEVIRFIDTTRTLVSGTHRLTHRLTETDSSTRTHATGSSGSSSSSSSSPFVGPVPGDIKVYDQRNGNSLVFNSQAQPPPAYPLTAGTGTGTGGWSQAAVEEMNTLIDATLETKNLYASISGGKMITWR